MFSFYLFSQTGYNGNIDLSKELCDYFEGNTFISNKNAEEALAKILKVSGISKNFIMKECSGIPNAAAATYKGVRYIFYNKEFMSEIINRTDNWSNLAILAHEVGHHINGHTLEWILYEEDIVKPTPKSVSRKKELEADYFSGFIMAKLGASLKQASQAISLISTNDDDSNSTHPSRSKRLKAIKNGYNAGYSEIKVVTKEVPSKTKPLTYEDYFYKAVDFHQKGNKSKALQNYSQSARLNNKFAPALHNRAILLDDYKRFNEALEDYNQAIAIMPNFPVYLFNRAITKYNIDDFEGAIEDINKGFEIDSSNLQAIKIKAQSLFNIEKFKESIPLFEKLVLELPEESSFYLLGLSYGFTGNHLKASELITKALDYNFDLKYIKSRVVSYVNSKQYDKAIEDYKLILKSDSEDYSSRLNLAKLLIQLNENNDACKELYVLKENFDNDEISNLIKNNCRLYDLKKRMDEIKTEN